MKKLLLLTVASFSLFGAVPTIYMAPPATAPSLSSQKEKKKEKESSPSNNPLAHIEEGAASKEKARKGSNEIMIISPEGRAKDIQAAIKFLQQHSPTSKPNIKLVDGSMISGILSVDVMPGGTLLIFKVATLKGVQYKIEKVEDIDTLEFNGT